MISRNELMLDDIVIYQNHLSRIIELGVDVTVSYDRWFVFQTDHGSINPILVDKKY